MSESFALKVVAGFTLALAVALLLPRAGWGGETPPVGALLAVSGLVTLFTAGALYLGIRRDLKLPHRIALYAAGYNALVVLVKFGLGPLGLYEVNQSVDLTGFFPVNDAFGATWTAVLVFLLYFAGYWLVYRIARMRLARGADAHAARRRRTVFPLVAAAYGVAGAGAALAVVVFAAWGSGVDQYLEFVFSSGVSVLVAVALAGAGSLAALALSDTAEQAKVVGDAALLVTFFWLGVAFLALYHALWVVYVLVLTVVWPLKVVVPK